MAEEATVSAPVERAVGPALGFSELFEALQMLHQTAFDFHPN
jgi:hypothetical protein